MFVMAAPPLREDPLPAALRQLLDWQDRYLMQLAYTPNVHAPEPPQTVAEQVSLPFLITPRKIESAHDVVLSEVQLVSLYPAGQGAVVALAQV